MVYQDRLETKLLQLFGHLENSKCFSIISIIIFEVNIVYEQKQTKLVTIFIYMFPFTSTVLLLPLLIRTIARMFSIGGSTSVHGGWHSEIWLNSTDLQCFIVQFGGLGAFYGGLCPQKALCSYGTASLPRLRRPWTCTLCQQTSPKRWFANVNMTSYCNVTKIVQLVKMTTIRHCWILKFGRGTSNQAVAPGITRLLHAIDLGF